MKWLVRIIDVVTYEHMVDADSEADALAKAQTMEAEPFNVETCADHQHARIADESDLKHYKKLEKKNEQPERQTK